MRREEVRRVGTDGNRSRRGKKGPEKWGMIQKKVDEERRDQNNGDRLTFAITALSSPTPLYRKSIPPRCIEGTSNLHILSEG